MSTTSNTSVSNKSINTSVFTWSSVASGKKQTQAEIEAGHLKIKQQEDEKKRLIMEKQREQELLVRLASEKREHEFAQQNALRLYQIAEEEKERAERFTRVNGHWPIPVKIRYLLDTHAFIWELQNPDKLGRKARQIIESAADGEIALTSHSIVELGRLIEEGIVIVSGRPGDWFAPAFRRFPVIPATLAAAIKAPVLALPHSDPFDRLIVAEALVLGVPLITKDGNITDSEVVSVVW